jgi:H/ACA ribonucleoprotein complex subunit 3
MTPVALLRCRDCGRYTLKQKCPSCGAATDRPGPARYSPEDRYGNYRRALKRATALEEGTSAGKQEEA